jgi:protoporphyrinogen oxidase
MLVRQRLSRIFFLGKFFDYPVALNWNTVSNLGLVRMIKIGWSYLLARLVPIKPEKSLEDFLINRFGRELYKTFFKDYTEKVWGMACAQISAEWGAQRIKGLSISRALLNIIKSWRVKTDDLKQKQVETSLIQKFLYPKLGPGQMWQEVAKKIEALGGEIHLNHEVVALAGEASSKIEAVSVRDSRTGEVKEVRGDYFFSTMPVQELIAKLTPLAPEIVRQVAQGLMYRDFVTVGLLMDKMKLGDNQTGRLKDNWIYIQEPQVKLGRLQIFNNWSPYLVADQATTWLGLEYFCTEGDELWTKSDEQFMADAVEELVTIGMIDSSDVIDRTIVRVKKAYPAYFGSYDQFAVIREFTDGITNLFLIGRNGMHKYNNQDHSMLTAMRAVDNIIEGIESKANIWSINAEQEYHEQKSS